jgi:hypothetical protein
VQYEMAASFVGSARAGMTTKRASGCRPYTMPVAYVAKPRLRLAELPAPPEPAPTLDKIMRVQAGRSGEGVMEFASAPNVR